MRKTISIRLNQAQYQELTNRVEKANMDRNTYILQELGLNVPSVARYVPKSVERFADGKFYRLRNNVYTTQKNGVYRHRAAGDYVVYEVRVDFKDQERILLHRAKKYASVFYNHMGQKICHYQTGHDIRIDHEFIAKLANGI
jgi:hypothetical protein